GVGRIHRAADATRYGCLDRPRQLSLPWSLARQLPPPPIRSPGRIRAPARGALRGERYQRIVASEGVRRRTFPRLGSPEEGGRTFRNALSLTTSHAPLPPPVWYRRRTRRGPVRAAERSLERLQRCDRVHPGRTRAVEPTRTRN